MNEGLTPNSGANSVFEKRLNTYSANHCWQYDVRVNNYDEDLAVSGFTREYVEALRVPDFRFVQVDDKKERQRMGAFIKRHEWLGNLSQFTTHWFACYHKDVMAGVILFNVPNTFSKMLGDNTPHLERLISRGACISWSPKNLASSFLMWCINWMVHNTTYRLFTAYSDPTAKEIGTIYQACNFYYMGQTSGTIRRYISPWTGKIVSDRYFRQKTVYRKLCAEIGIEWKMEWMRKTGMNWHLIPDDIEARMRAQSKLKQSQAKLIEMPPKHKYAYVLGVNKKETSKLRKLFEERNKTYPYPKERGK